jgi:hypothetical protein
MRLQRIELRGLDAANLLGYMAALGTLRTLTIADPAAEVRMSWTEAPGRWMPVLHHSKLCGCDDVTSELARLLCVIPDPDPFHDDCLQWTPERFGEHVRNRVEAMTEQRRNIVDFLAALGSEIYEDNGKPQTTALRAIGAGNNEGFIGYMRTIRGCTKSDRIRAALFKSWDYADDKPVMRWDPNEYRPHALRDKDPSKDTRRFAMRGANRLAIEALPLFPTMPTLTRLRTTSFVERDGVVAALCPVWEDPLDVATVSSLLALSDVEQIARATDARERARLRRKLMAREVRQVYWVERFTDGKYRNFKPSVALL